MIGLLTYVKGEHTLLQMVIATVLMIVLFFGIGFILNMLMKTTWFPLYAFIALVIGVVIYGSIGEASFLSSGESFTIVDIVPAIGGLVGAILSGSAIKALRIEASKCFKVLIEIGRTGHSKVELPKLTLWRRPLAFGPCERNQIEL